MKKYSASDLISLILIPILVMVLGLVLLVNPDSASALIAKIIGWVLIAAAIGSGVAAILTPAGRAGRVACAIIFAIGGGWLHTHPLMLAAMIGRFCGIFLLIQGLQDIRVARHMGRRWRLPGLVTVIGFCLILVPMSASRILFSLCGLVILAIGLVMLIDRLRQLPRLTSGQDSDIIDAL